MNILAGKYGKSGLAMLVCAAMLLFSSVAWASPQHSVAEWLDMGKQLVAEGKYDEAITAYDTALREYPDDVSLLKGRGYAYNNLAGESNLAKAADDFQKVISMGDEDIDVYISLAEIASCMDRMDDCQKLFEQAANINSEYAPLYIQRAMMYYCNIADYENALKDLEQAKAFVTPDGEAELLCDIMSVYESYARRIPAHTPDVLKAANDLLAVQNLAPEYAIEGYDCRMKVYEKMGRYSDALSDSQSLLALVEGQGRYIADTLRFQSKMLYKLHHYDEAKQVMLEALKQDASIGYPSYYEDDPDFAAYNP